MGGRTSGWTMDRRIRCMYAVLYCTVLYCTVYCMYTVCILYRCRWVHPGRAILCNAAGRGQTRTREKERAHRRACVWAAGDKTGQARQADRARQGKAGQGRQAGDTRLNRQAVQLWPRNLQEGEDVFPVILPLPLHFTYTLTHHTDATRRTAPHRPHHSHLIVPCASRVFPPRPRPLPFRPPRRHRRR